MQNDPMVGQQLGAYLIQSKLGEGGMARVYKAYHARLRRDVAIKVILSQIADHEGFRVRFEREAQLIASLEHPNIVAVYDFGEVGNLTYLVMQYVGGGTLRDQLRNGRPLEPLRAMRYALQMARALHHAHLRGIVHRDVKPQNMLISSSDPNLLLLSDFGIAKLFTGGPDATWTTAPGSMYSMSSDSSLTNAGQIVGTAEYMSPEQINGKPVDARTDVYALGVVLFQMLTGEVPFQSTTVQGLLFQHVYTPPRSVREINPYVPEILGQITAKAMAKAPEHRFQSAEEMAQALEFANANTTNALSATVQNSLSTFGLSPHNVLSSPSQNRSTGSPVSHYGQQAVSGAPLTAPPGQHTAYEGAMRASGNTDRITAPGIGNQPVATAVRSTNLFRLSSVGAGLILLLAIVLIIVKVLPSGGTTSPTQTSVAAKSFIETFQDNHLMWTVGNINGLTAILNPNDYSLDIAQSANSGTYFPYPSAAGTLPANFTWTVQIARNTAGADTFYGLAFRLTDDGHGGNVRCYAFVIDGHGDYQVLKYSPGSRPTMLWSGQHAAAIKGALGQSNQLQVIVKGNNFFFSVNGIAINASDKPISDNSGSASYTGGTPAIMVAGSDTSNVSFSVTKAQLAIP